MEEREAKVCRLCGQHERLYVDVFGEEGTRRFLGLKIHTKINILIQKDDGLPQQVCLKCLGTLDFMFEFFTQCHNIQQKFWSANKTRKAIAPPKACDVDIEAEASKENTTPVRTLLSRATNNHRKQRRDGKQKGILLPIKKRNRTITADIVNKKETNDSLETLVNYPLRTRNLSTIVKQEHIDIEEVNSGNCSIVAPKTNHDKSAMVWIPFDMSQPNELDMRRELEASAIANLPPSDDQEESKKFNTASLAEENMKFSITVLSPNNELIVPESLEKTSCHEALTVSQNDASNNLANKRSLGKIAQFINEDQKQIIETSYKIDMNVVDDEELAKHIILSNKKNIKCNICSARYLRLDKCKVHVMAHLNMKPYKCTICNFATVTTTNIRAHIWKSHLKIKPFACDQCEKRFVNAILLQEHLNTHTGARPYKCQQCDFTCASRQVLSSHNTIHKPSKDIVCEICGKMFYSNARMRAHMQVHNKDKGVICSICKTRLQNEMSLEVHMQNIHSRSYVCNVCGKQLSCRKAWHNHQNVHAKAKYHCTMCPNVYKSRHILKEHLLKHEGIRKYKCTICKKTFGQQSHLAAHAATHSNIRFACPGCDKLFNRHDNMKTHTKRCRLFTEKPELATLIVRRFHTKSTNEQTKLVNKTTFLGAQEQCNEKPAMEDLSKIIQ